MSAQTSSALNGRKPMGRVALVTGAASGMGKAIVERLVAEGVPRVLAVDVRPFEACEGAQALVLDVTDEQTVMAAVADQAEAIDMLVNCAGVYAWRDSFSFSLDNWRRTFEVNVFGAYTLMREVSNRLIAEGKPGAIVNFASVAGRIAFPHQADYCASKAAVIGLTRAACLDLAEHRITVNAIAPGTVNTPMIDQVARDIMTVSGLDYDDQLDALVAGIPLRRMLEPAEIAGTVAFLLSQDATGITGETINLDSGTVRD